MTSFFKCMNLVERTGLELFAHELNIRSDCLKDRYLLDSDFSTVVIMHKKL